MSDTTHNVNVNVKTQGADKAADDIGRMGKEAKKIHQQTMGQGKKEAAVAKTTSQQTKRERQERQRNTPRELRDLQAKNKLFDQENKIRRERLKLLANEERASRTTFRGGFRGGLKDRLLPRGPRDRGEAGQVAGQMLGGVLAAAVGGLAAAAVGALARLVATPFRAIGEEYEAYRNYAQQLLKLAGYAGGGVTAGAAKKMRLGPGQALGYSQEEVISATAQTARATGSYKGTGIALGLSRLLGQDVSETTGMFGQMRQAGYSDFTRKGDAFRDLVKAMAAGVESGMEKARLPDFLSGVMDLTSRAAGREAGDVSTAPFARLLATLGRSGLSGLQGARGAAVAKALEEGFTSPGGGEEGQALAMDVMGFGRGKSFYEAKRALQLGTTSENPEFIRNMIEGINARTISGEEANIAIGEMLGGRLTYDQIEGVQKTLREGGDPTTQIAEAMETEKDILSDIRTLLSGGNDEFLHEARRAAKIANENIDNGAELKSALEELHDIMREFINENIETVKKVLEELAAFMQEMRPVLHTLSETMAALVEWLPGSIRSSSQLYAAGVEEINALNSQRQSVLGGTNSQLSRLGDYTPGLHAPLPEHLQERVRLTPHLGELYRAYSAEASRLSTLPTQERTVAYDSLSVTPGESDVIRQADALARALEFNQATGPTDTSAEIRAMLSFLVAQGVNMPVSVRAILDRTGGPQ